MLTFKSALATAQKRGDQKIDGFTGMIRDFDFAGLVVGDEFIVPEQFEVYRQKMSGKDRNGEDVYAEYIFVETQNGTKQFFPSMFSKNVVVYENTPQGAPLKVSYKEDGTANTIHTSGTACDLFREALPDVNEGMKKLAGKKVRISGSTKVRTKAFGRDVLTNSTVYKVDLV